jgi:ribose-phosphate pyrophosphokinase
MNILNLADPEKSDIGFKISNFPDGQQSITINTNTYSISTKVKTVQIKSRLNSFRDLELIICANQALLEMGAKSVSLYVPYFLGARSDRKFLAGASNYLKTVICPIINAQNFAEVHVLDPHSDVLEACLNNYKKTSNHTLVSHAIVKSSSAAITFKEKCKQVTLVSPDAGALKKIYDVAEQFEIEDIVVASKHRDIKTGKITHTDVPGLSTQNVAKHFLIVDDICDGGRTFIELAKAIRKVRPQAQTNDTITLVITHGIFSSGLKELNKLFDGIYTTNSIRPENDPEFLLQNDNELHKLNIYNIF